MSMCIFRCVQGMNLIKMPKSSLTMTEGTILQWYKQEGEKIEKGELEEAEVSA